MKKSFSQVKYTYKEAYEKYHDVDKITLLKAFETALKFLDGNGTIYNPFYELLNKEIKQIKKKFKKNR